MAQTPTSKSAPINNAAKDDHVGGDGDFTFTIADLLANDPGGAAKVNVATQFFFGDSGAGDHSIAAQKAYLDAHHILYNDAFTEFTLTSESDPHGFNYFVQIGNKGTWSEAHVDITAPECSAENIVTNSTFNGVTIPVGQDWAIAPIAGWDNTGAGSGNGIEAWNHAGLDARTTGHLVPTGSFVIETDAWGEGNPNPVTTIPVQDVYQTKVDAVDGE